MARTVTFTSPQGTDIWTIGQTQTVSWTKVASADNPNNLYLSVKLYQVFNNLIATLNYEYFIRKYAISYLLSFRQN